MILFRHNIVCRFYIQDNQSGQEGQDGQQGQQDQSGQSGQDGQQGSSQSQQGGMNPQDLDKTFDKVFKDTDKQMPEADDKMTQDELEEAIKEVQDEKNNESNLTAQERKKLLDKERQEREKRMQALREMDKNYTPIKWQRLIKQMIPKPTEVEEESLSKMHRRTVGQLALGNKMTAVKAGISKDEAPSQDLLFILDSSGSMSDIISSISQDLLRLINKNKSFGIKNMYIIRFDSSWDVYRVFLDMRGKKHTFQPFKNKLDILKDPENAKLVGKPKPIKQLFEMQWGAGTEFPKEILKVIEVFLKNQVNQVLFTDSDVLYGKNLKVLKKACKLGLKKPYSFNLILNNLETYKEAVKKLGTKYKYMSYLK